MKIHLDLSLCNAYGNCVMEAPEEFDLDEDSGKAVLLREEIGEEARARVESAVQVCPVQAISLVE
ncbi:ferredoxin [Blastococcus sp. SYSU D00820]